MNFNTRNNVRSDDVDGAQVMQYHKFYHNKEEYMGPKDPPKKTMAELRKHKTNPADPSYMVASDNVPPSLDSLRDAEHFVILGAMRDIPRSD